MDKLILIALGGAFGAVLRYGISGWVQRWTDSSFPYGTLVVNVIGCFAIGLCGALIAGPYLSEKIRPLILIGVLGSFTTFSTFGYETFEMINDGQFGRAGLNVLLSNVAGLAAVWIGYRLTEQIAGG